MQIFVVLSNMVNVLRDKEATPWKSTKNMQCLDIYENRFESIKTYKSLESMKIYEHLWNTTKVLRGNEANLESSEGVVLGWQAITLGRSKSFDTHAPGISVKTHENVWKTINVDKKTITRIRIDVTIWKSWNAITIYTRNEIRCKSSKAKRLTWNRAKVSIRVADRSLQFWGFMTSDSREISKLM